MGRRVPLPVIVMSHFRRREKKKHYRLTFSERWNKFHCIIGRGREEARAGETNFLDFFLSLSLCLFLLHSVSLLIRSGA